MRGLGNKGVVVEATTLPLPRRPDKRSSAPAMSAAPKKKYGKIEKTPPWKIFTRLFFSVRVGEGEKNQSDEGN